MKSILKLSIIIISLLCMNCTEKSNQERPALKSDLEKSNLELDPKSVVNADTVNLILEQTFESNENVFLDGSLSKTIIDDRDQVVIAVQWIGKLGIYVFNPSGDVKTVLGRFGRGPGEFEAITSMTITNDTLWVLDTRLQKISMFSLVDYKHLKDELLDKSFVVGEDKFTRLMKGTRFLTVNDDKVFVKFEVLSFFEPNMFTKSVYYEVSEEGKILPAKTLQQSRYSMYLFKERRSGRELGFTAPFTRRSLFTTDQKGDIYTAWNENVSIKKYNSNGEFIKEFYFEMKKSPLDLDKIEMFRDRKKAIEEQGAPETWPALHSIQADDEGRLWISTITDSDSTFKWYVVDGSNGNLSASFTLKGKRSEITPHVGQPFYQIKNGYFYTREYDYDQGIDRIVKYKIEFKERE